MSEPSIELIRLKTTRVHEKLFDPDAVPHPLTGKQVFLRIVSGNIVVDLSEGAGVGFTNEALGQYWWEVSAAQHTTLGNPNNVSVYLTVMNADNSVDVHDIMDVNYSW